MFLTEQEIFDRSANHLLTQNTEALNEDRTCLYHAPNGMKCAVGCFIPNEAYTPDIEGCSLDELRDQYRDIMEFSGLNLSSVEVLDLCRSLQMVHDTKSPDDWAGVLLALARVYSLSIDNIPKLKEFACS